MASIWNKAVLYQMLLTCLYLILLQVSVQPAGVPEAGAQLLSTSQSPRPASQPEGEVQQRRMKQEQ